MEEEHKPYYMKGKKSIIEGAEELGEHMKKCKCHERKD